MNLKIQFNAMLSALLILSISAPGSLQINSKVIVETAKYGWKAIQAVISIESAIETQNFQKEIIDKLDKIRQRTERIEHLITDEANRIIKELTVVIDMQIVGKFVRVVSNINERFEKKFLKYFTSNKTYQLETIEDYINTTIHSSTFQRRLKQIEECTIPTNLIQIEEKLVFGVLHDYMGIIKNHHRDCNQGESSYDLLFKVYNLAINTLSKGYSMLAHAYRYRQLSSNDPNSWKSELQDTLDNYQEVVLKIAQAARIFMNIQSKEIRRCDPTEFKEDENYVSYNFLTTFVTSSYLLDNKQAIMDYVLRGRRTAVFCDGFKYDCVIDKDISSACLASADSKRRYDYVEETNFIGQVYTKGRVTKNCDSDGAVDHVYGSALFLRCICDEYRFHKKRAYLNVSSVYSDFRNSNRVITGIRLVTKMSITYFELQCGSLVNGNIDNNTVNWDDRVSIRLEAMKRWNLRPLYTDNDLHELRYFNRSLNLDNIALPEGWVAVGVRFRLLLSHDCLSFEVAGIQIFDESGNPITSDEPRWFGPGTSNRNELPKKDLDVPTYSSKVNVELSIPGKHYVQFKMSGWWVDASQTLYPFIDIQEVTTNPPAPVGGVGIFYKGQEGFGGFVALKLLSRSRATFMGEEYLINIFNNKSNSDINVRAVHVEQVY